MCLDLLDRHVYGLLSAVLQTEVSGIADDGELLTLVLVFLPPELAVPGESVVADQFSLPDIHGIRDSGISAGSETELHKALVANNEVRLHALVPAVFVLVGIVEGYDVGIAEARLNGEVEGCRLQCALHNRHGGLDHGLLKVLVRIDKGDDGGEELRSSRSEKLVKPLPHTLLVEDRVQNRVDSLLLLHSGLIRLGSILNDVSHIKYPP